MSVIFNPLDTHYNSQSGFSVGANIGLTPATKDPKPDTKDTQTPSGTKLNSEHLALNTSSQGTFRACPIEIYILNGQTDEHYLQLIASRPAN